MKEKPHFTQHPLALTVAFISAIVGLLAFFTGRQSLPQMMQRSEAAGDVREATTHQDAAAPEVSSIRVERDDRGYGRVRGMTVYVDGRRAGSVWSGRKEEIRTTPGRHAVYVEIAGWQSETVETDVGAGELVIIHTAVTLNGPEIVVGATYPPRTAAP